MTLMHPLVSIVTPVYDRVEFLHVALDSVLAQTYPNVEIVVVDDGSTTDVRPHLAGYDGRVTFSRMENGGPAAARNHGMRIARGEFVMFLDDDDALRPDAVDKLVAAAEHAQAAWAVGRYAFVDRQGEPTGREHGYRGEPGDVYEKIIVRNAIGAPLAVLIRTRELREIGGFDEARTLQTCEDYDLWLAFARAHCAAVVPDVIANYRVYDGNATRNRPRHLEALIRVLHKHRAVARPDTESLFDCGIARVHTEWGDLLYLQGDTRAARAHWRQAVAGGQLKRVRFACRTAKSYLPAPVLSVCRLIAGYCRGGRR
jgi:glycosyltransferase involved in cell wall biosynthesis